MTIVYKILNKNEPQYLGDKLSFKTLDMTSRYNTSKIKQLEVPFNRKRTQGDRGFSFTGPSYWNQLPNYIKEAENLGKFKKLLKTDFLDYHLINPLKVNNTYLKYCFNHTYVNCEVL